MAIKFLSDTTHKKGDIHLDGTSSERLDLDSGVKITGQYKANGNTEYTYINMYNGGDASINIGTKHSLGYISFESGNGAYTERMRITNTGKIGVGTSSPKGVMEINVSGATNQLLLTQGSTDHMALLAGTVGGGIIVEDNNFFGIWHQDYANRGTENSITERFRINSSGNVGIGTTSPSGKLHIHNTSTTSDGDGSATQTTSGQDSILLYGHGGTNGSTYGGITWLGGDRRRAMITAVAENADSDFIGLAFYTQGTDGPGDFYESMRISKVGNVGIGTTNPENKLHLLTSTTDTTQQLLIQNGSTGDAAIKFNISGDTYSLGIDNSDGDKFKLSAGNLGTNDRIVVDSSGNVGFGTASPSAKLHVAGAIKTTGDVTMSSNTTLHIGNVDLTTGSGGNTVSVEAATSSGTAMNFKTSSGTVAAYMVYQGTTTTRFAGRVEPSGNRTLDLGTDALRWRVVYCETLDSAGQHESNLQDREQPVGQYITGTVLSWKNGKNRPCTQFADHMRMGIAVLGQDSPLVQGAEPVLCTGIVEEGDYLVTSEKEGHAVAIPRHIVKEQLLFDCVIGKALQDGEGESHLIKTWINI